jgi:hypothetical protein
MGSSLEEEPMMKVAIRLLAVTVGALAIAAPSAFAQQCKPVVGNFEAHVVVDGCASPILCTAGRVWGGLQGNYYFTMQSALPNGHVDASSNPDVPSILFFTGDSVVTLKKGDQVFGTDTGAIDLPPGQGGFASLITFKNGTGAAAGTTGQIRLRGEFDPVEGTTSGDYLGTICTP